MTPNRLIGGTRVPDPRWTTATLVALTILAAVVGSLAGCSGGGIPIDAELVARVACAASGGAWDLETGACKLPQPTPPGEGEEPAEPPPPPAETCEPDLSEIPWAHDLGADCSTADRPVKHQPPGDACPSLVPACPEEPTTPPAPPPAPGDCPAEGALVETSCGGHLYHDAIKAATTAIGDRPGTPRQRQDAVAAALATGTGACVISGKEAIFARRPDGLFGEYHVVHSTKGTWTNSGRGKWIGCHRVGGAAAEPEPPAADDTFGCPAPLPPFGNQGSRFKVKCDASGHYPCDVTPSVRGHAYCVEIGMGTFNGVDRNDCPVRPEGNEFRFPCEQYFSGGYPRIRCSNGDANVKPDNPLRFGCPDGAEWAEVCRADGTLCARKPL